MTIPATASRMPAYVGNDTADTFAFSFRVDSADELRVILVDSDGVETVLTLTTHYTLDGVGDPSGGSVVLVENSAFAWQSAGKLATGYSLVPLRVPSMLQESRYSEAGRYHGDDAEEDLDRAAMRDLWLQDQINRTPVVPESESTIGKLPKRADRISAFAAYDSNGDPMAAAGVASAPATAFAATLLDDVDAAGMRQTLGDVVRKVDTIAAMKALAGTDLAGDVIVEGYGAAGDGGGGLFRWNSADSSTDNAGTIIAPNAGGTGRWNRVVGPKLRASWFGAVGDGETDDTTAMTKLLAAAGTLGKHVELTGTHKITSALSFNNASATPGLTLSAPSRSGYGIYQAFTGIGLTLFGRDITIANVYFANDGAHLAGSTALEIAGQRMVAERLLVDAPDVGVFVYHPTNVVVRDSEIRCTPTTLKGIYGFQANGDAQHPNQVVIDNNVIVDYAGGNTVTTGILMENIDTLHVRRTNCQSLNVGVQVDSAGGGSYTANLIHIGPNNNIEDCVTPVSLANATNVWVFGNEITPSNRGNNAIVANTVGPLLIAGNLLVNTQHENVLCTSCNGVTITGNTTGDASRAATGTYATIKLDTCIKSVVTGNTLIGRSSVSIDPLCCVLLTNCTGAMVSGNYYDEQLGPFSRVQTSGTKVNVFTDHKTAEGDLWWGRYLKDQSAAYPIFDAQGNGNTLAGMFGNWAGDSDVAIANCNSDGVHGGGVAFFQMLTSGSKRLLAFFRGTLSAILYVPPAANKSPDGALGNSYMTYYLDESGNTLTFRVKYSDGTLKTGTVALT